MTSFLPRTPVLTSAARRGVVYGPGFRAAKSDEASSATPYIGEPEDTDFPPWLNFPHRPQTVIEPTTSVVVSQRCPPQAIQASRRSRLMVRSCASAGRDATDVTRGPGSEADEISALEGVEVVEVLAGEIYSVCASSFTSIAVSLPSPHAKSW